MVRESMWLAVPRLKSLVIHAIICVCHYQDNMPSWNTILCKKLEVTNILKPEYTIQEQQLVTHVDVSEILWEARMCNLP